MTQSQHPQSHIYSGRIFWISVLVITVTLIYMLRDMLMPFLLGAGIAYLLDPLANRLERNGIGRTWASLMLVGLFFLMLAGFIVLLVPLIQAQLGNLLEALPQYIAKLMQIWQGIIDRYGLEHQLGQIDMNEFLVNNSEKGAAVAGSLVSSLAGQGMAVLNFLSLLFLTPVVAFFLLQAWPELLQRIRGLCPRRHVKTISELASRMDRNLGNFVRGQALISAILAIYYALALSLAGLKSGFAVGILGGFLTFIPYIGTVVTGILSIGLALLQFDDIARVGVIAGIYVLGQMIEGNFLSPKIMGDQLGLHPLWIIFAVLAGGTLMGLFGMLLALPLLAVTMVLAQFLISEYKKSKYYKK